MSAAVDAVSKVFAAVFKPIAKLLAPSVDNPKASDTSNTKQTIRSGKEPAHYIYGRTATGGVLFWAQEEPGDDTKREKLHMAYLLAEGEIDGIEQVYVNQELASEYGDLVEWELHVNRSTPDPYMLEHCPDWKDSQIGRGVSWVRVTLTFDKDKFATGIPDLLFVVRGNRNIYDPRTGQTGYSDNAVLCTLDYVRNRLGVSDQFIIFDAWAAAANVAGEMVADPDGVMRPRYAIGGVYKADQRKDETLASLEENFGGTTRRIGGYWGVEVGAYYGPAVATLTEDMVIGTVSGRTEVKRSDAINSVAGKWNSPTDLWEETSYPTVTVDEWVAEDGGENSDTLDTPFSPSAHQSQRLANIKLRRQRAGGQLQIPLNHAGYQFRPGRIINVDLPTINVSGEFKVLEWRFGAKKGSTIVVRQEDAEFYDDAVGEPFDYLSIIQTPTGGIGSPTNLRYTVETVGEVVQGRLTWDPVNAAIDYNVVVQRGTEVIQAVKTPSGATTCTLSGLGAGDYTASVTARGLQSTSGPATIAFSILNPPQPERVITQTDRTNVMLIPVLADGDSLGGGTWEYRWGVTNVFADAEYLGRGDTITHTGRSPGQVLYYWVRGVNAYGASDWFALSVTTSENFDDVIAAIDEDLRRPGGLVDQFQSGINDNAGAIDAAREEFETGLTEANTAISNAQGRIDGLDTRVDTAEGAISDAQGRIDGLDTKTDETNQALSDARADLENSIEQTNSDVADANDAITAANGRIDGVESLANSNDDRLTAVASDVETLSGEVDGNTASITETSKILELDGKLEAIRAAVSAAQNAVGSATQSVETLTRISNDEALAQRITELSVDFDGNVAQLRQQLTTVVDDTQSISDNLETLRSEYDGTTADFESRITTVASEAQALSTRLDNLTSETDGSIADIQQTLTTLANDSEALSTSLQSLRSEYEGFSADADQRLTTLATQQQSTAQALQTLSSEYDDSTADFESRITTVTNAQQATADALSSLQSSYNDSSADFDQRITTLASQNQAIAELVTGLESRVDQNVATIQETQRTVALNEKLEAITSAVSATQNAVGAATQTVETLTRISGDEALAQRITTLSVDFDGNVATLTQQLTTLADDTQAISDSLDSLSAGVGDSNADFEQRITALATETSTITQDVTSLQSQLGDAVASIDEVQQTQILDGIYTALQNAVVQTQSAVGSASISIERLTSVSERQSLSQQITEVNTAFETAESSIRQELSSLSSEDQALAQSIDTLSTEFDDSSAEFDQRITTLSNEQGSTAQSLTDLEADYEDNKSSVQSDLTTLSNDQQSTAQSLTALETEYSDNKSSVSSELASLSSADTSLAQSIETLDTQFGNRASSIESNVTSLSNEQQSIAQRQDTFEASVDDEFASVNQDISAVYDPSTGAVAQAVTTVTVNGKKAMIGIQVDGEEAQIVAVADTFAVLNPISGELVTAFVVTDGRVVIPEAFIDRLTITKLRAADGSLAFENGKLRADLIETNQLIVSLDNVSDGYLRRGTLWSGVRVEGGDSIGYIQDRAREGGTSYDRVTDWTRPSSTLIDGNKIFTGDAYVDTLQIKGDAVIVPAIDSPGSVLSGTGYSREVINRSIYLDQAGMFVAIFSCRQGYNSGEEPVSFELVIDGATVYSGSSSAYVDYVSISGARYLDRGYRDVKVYWNAPSSVTIGNRTCIIMGVKR